LVESLFGSENEIVEQRHAVGLRPNADCARFLESVVFDLEKFLPVEETVNRLALNSTRSVFHLPLGTSTSTP